MLVFVHISFLRVCTKILIPFGILYGVTKRTSLF